MAPKTNPFRIHGVVSDQYFTNRDTELDRILRTLGEPGAKLLIYGPRRMGKTSTMMTALARHRARDGVAFLADFSTASTVVDLANRILSAAGQAIGKRWRDAISDFVKRLGMTITLTPDPTTGLILPGLDVSLRSASLEDQRATLATALDAIDRMAQDRGTPIGIVLDEFQEIQRFGGETAEWHLRGIIQHHSSVSYVLAGSQTHLIDRMLDQGRAFYGLVDQLQFGPMDGGHLALWIDERMSVSGVKATGVGERIVAIAGMRTRDIVQVARQCFDNCKTTGQARQEHVVEAFDDVVAEQEALFQSIWSSFSMQQQNILRAIAANLHGLTTSASMKQFGLTSSGAAANSAGGMVENGHLVKAPSRTGYAFDNPFFCRWVTQRTLGDLGAEIESETNS